MQLNHEIISFEECLETSRKNHRGKGAHISLLLGNGFSVAQIPSSFSYIAIREHTIDKIERKDKSTAERIRQIFEMFETEDFEIVLSLLNQTMRMAPFYDAPHKTLTTIESDCNLLRNSLAESIADLHPAYQSRISDESFESCGKFIQNFRKLYTLNFDLLVYWTIMKQNLEKSFKDGFGRESSPQGELYWEDGKNKAHNPPDLFFVHGAIHLYSYGERVVKLAWDDSYSGSIRSQTLTHLNKGNYPTFVADGDSESKMAAIRKTPYLHHAYLSLRNNADDMVVFGCSLAQSDDHILRALSNSTKRSSVYIGVYGDPANPTNKEMISRCSQAFGSSSTTLYFFDSTSAPVWSSHVRKAS